MSVVSSVAVKSPVDRPQYFRDLGLTEESTVLALKQFEHLNDAELPIISEIDHFAGTIKLIWFINYPLARIAHTAVLKAVPQFLARKCGASPVVPVVERPLADGSRIRSYSDGSTEVTRQS